MIREIYARLDDCFQKEIVFIKSKSPFEHLIAVILSAQTTDRQVNKVIPVLFSRYPGPAELANAELEEVKSIIRPIGFFHVKGKHIIAAAQTIQHTYGGNVPQAMDQLLSIPGVGRKSANVLRGNCFGLPAIIVDTHFARVVNRLGLVSGSTPERIEEEIGALLPEHAHYRFSMTVNMHGRTICHAKRPACASCILEDLCRKKGLPKALQLNS